MNSSFVAMAMLSLLMIMNLSSVDGKIYNITEGWVARNNDSSLEQFSSFEQGNTYRLVIVNVSKREFIQSDSGLFELGFYHLNGTSDYYLSVMMGNRTSTLAVPVWTSNREQPLSNSLALKKLNGRLVLQDSKTEAVSSWSDVSKLELEDSGNLVFFNDSGEIVWQSFDHPADVMLPSQRLATGQKLTSNSNSTTLSEGVFTVSIEASGVALFVKSISSHEQQPYFVWSLKGSTLEAVQTQCPDYITVLEYTATGAINMAFAQTMTSTQLQPCGSPLGVTLATEKKPRFIRLMENGELVSYKLTEDSRSWKADFKLTEFFGQKECSLPLKCGSYGICDTAGACSCLDNTRPDNNSFHSGTCQQPSWSSLTNCSSEYVTEFVTLSSVSYFTNQYMTPDRLSSSVEDCLQACRSNCSCSALFYDKSARNCLFVKDIVGTFASSQQQNYDAYLKFQDYTKLVEVRKQQSNSRNRLIIVTCSIAAAMVLISASLLLLWELKRRQKAEIASVLLALHGPPRNFTYRRLANATENFTKLVGSGGFGSVYEGVFSGGKRLAVKKLHSTSKWQKQFITEVTTMGRLSHINIVKLCGYCAEPAHHLLVYEFMANGSLDRWIFKPQQMPLGWIHRYNIALGTARGLAYLHEESREPIIHLDIKPQNILLDESFVPKVGDFGMAKLLMNRDVSQVMTGVRGTAGYLAPEWLLHAVATRKCDVYSYGMVLLELIGGRRNLESSKVDSSRDWYFPAWAVEQMKEGNLLSVVDENIRHEVEIEQAVRMIKVAFWCIQENPGDRPGMDQVVQMLEGQQEVNEPPLNFHFAVLAPGMISIRATQDNIAVAYSENQLEH